MIATVTLHGITQAIWELVKFVWVTGAAIATVLIGVIVIQEIVTHVCDKIRSIWQTKK